MSLFKLAIRVWRLLIKLLLSLLKKLKMLTIIWLNLWFQFKICCNRQEVIIQNLMLLILLLNKWYNYSNLKVFTSIWKIYYMNNLSLIMQCLAASKQNRYFKIYQIKLYVLIQICNLRSILIGKMMIMKLCKQRMFTRFNKLFKIFKNKIYQKILQFLIMRNTNL